MLGDHISCCNLTITDGSRTKKHCCNRLAGAIVSVSFHVDGATISDAIELVSVTVSETQVSKTASELQEQVLWLLHQDTLISSSPSSLQPFLKHLTISTPEVSF